MKLGTISIGQLKEILSGEEFPYVTIVKGFSTHYIKQTDLIDKFHQYKDWKLYSQYGIQIPKNLKKEKAPDLPPIDTQLDNQYVFSYKNYKEHGVVIFEILTNCINKADKAFEEVTGINPTLFKNQITVCLINDWSFNPLSNLEVFLQEME